MSKHPITSDDVARAACALEGITVRTPLLENADVNEMLGGRLLLKPENFQRTGAFKVRGAYNRVLNLSDEERSRGTVSYSSGNHALGLALASKMLGSCATIVMPSDTPSAKMAATRALGAEIILFDRDTEDSADVVARIQFETGRVEVPPSAHSQVLAGAGTTALELLEDAPTLDAVLVPCGGGGLTAATAIVMSEGSPHTDVYALEPSLFNDTQRSLAARTRLANRARQRTICDAIMTPIPNQVTFPINLDLLAGALTATDNDVRKAMRFAFEHFKIVTEPGAVVGLAAILSGRISIKDQTIATIITGGNIDAARFFHLLGDAE